jgi:hypothetical protein
MTQWVFIASFFLLVPIILALPYGVLVVALAVSFSRLCLQLPAVIYASRGTPVRLRDYIDATFFVVTVPFAAACLASLFYVSVGCRLWGMEPSLSYVWEANTLPFGAALSVILLKITLMLGVLLIVALVWPAAREAYLATYSEVDRFRKKKHESKKSLPSDTADVVKDV